MYQLPQYPTNRLEALLRIDALARLMIQQQDDSVSKHQALAILISCDHILHTGSMAMTALTLLIKSHPKHTHYTIIYDGSQPQTEIITLTNQQLTTSFGHRITVQGSDKIPIWIEELCCMIQLYTTITDLSIISNLENFQNSAVNINTPSIRVGGQLRSGLNLEDSLVQDEKVLTQLAMGQVEDQTINSYSLLSTMIEYYRRQITTHTLIPVSYHNSALIDGQKEATTSYCAALIV